MGKKKRRSSETQPPSQPPTTSIDPPTPMAELLPPEILRKGLTAILMLQKGYYFAALKMTEGYVSDHKDSPHLQSLEALIRKHFCEKIIDSFDMKLKKLNQAVTSAESANKKCPNSLYFASLLAELLYERAEMTQEGWDLVIRQCKNALNIENSTDPGVDRFLEENEMRNSSKESRIEDGKKQIIRYLHASQHRIKVDAAEIELRMKRMKALIGDWIVKKQGEINFSAMKDKGNAKEAQECKDLWRSSLLSAKKKKELQSVNLKGLEKLLNSLGRDDLTLHLSEAISAAKEYKTWKYWECFCGNKFGDCNMYKSHFRQSHGSILTLLKEEIGVSNEWIANYLKGKWKPMDTDMATQFIVHPLESEFDNACDNELAVSGDLVENPGMGRYLDCYVIDDLVFDMKERVVFNTHFSGLLFRGRELNAFDIEGIADNASAAPFPLDVDQEVNSDDFLSWLYEGLIWGDLDTWTSRRDSQRKKAKEVYQIFEEECSNLKKICKDDEISKLQCKIKAIQVVDSYIDEIEDRETSPGHVAEHWVNFLRRRLEDLEGKDSTDSVTESEVISDVLKEAPAAVGQAAPSSDQARFRECSPEDGLGVQEEYLKPTDNQMRLALKSVCEKIVFKNAMVLRSAGSIQQYETILEKVSSYDYRSLIVPLLKLLFQTLLESLLEKHDIDMLAKDLAIDDEKSKGSYGKTGKKHNKKNKKKKKKENFRKPEGTNSGKNSVPVQRDKEDDSLKPEVGASVGADEVNKSIAINKSLPEDGSEDHRKSDSEPPLVVNVLGVGLKNEALDCFLNVIIQSLWHLIEFRVELMSRSIPGHEHIDQNACIFCALRDIFSKLKEASADKQGEAVDPTYFRNALIAHTGSFMKGEKHDAFDCLEVILKSLHGSFISVLPPKDQDQCSSTDCFVHTIFGWDHHEMLYCGDCNVESWHQKSTPLSFNVNATILRMMKDTHMNSSFDELLKLVQMDEKRICDQCREMKPIYHTLRCLPRVFTVVLGWAKDEESAEDISRTLSAISKELNLNVIFQGYQSDSEYLLVSMVCFYGVGDHYICFIYNQKLEKYVQYNDTSVEVTGSWKDVVDTINRRRLQPSILFFHQKSRMKFDETRNGNELLV